MSFLYRSLISFRLLPFHSLSRRGQSDYMIQKQSPLPPESKFFFFFSVNCSDSNEVFPLTVFKGI